jgi:hypothetical protein
VPNRIIQPLSSSGLFAIDFAAFGTMSTLFFEFGRQDASPVACAG